ncbi:3-mercaptopyruvate sulfurtransferase [Sneathiella glossodoripedis]|uniref:3-mercaptopyruvate sulfurtransferase n=1 Tax=Sneathiella glossodoripedis TaxID=418853 RepID=UPI0004722B27|nr:3-mercaptopyruvate sulfurtransferase [Sneathiella glossodoripedis]
MSYANPTSLVSTEWLSLNMSAPDIRIVDASWYLPGENRDAKAEFEKAHIPGAVFFDIDEIADTDVDLPHMIPAPEKFSSKLRKLGLGDGNRIVVYDGSGIRSAARAWWMIRLFGHDDVAILDGGFAKWQAEGRPISDMPSHPAERHFTSRMNSLMVKDKDQVLRNVEVARAQVLDARSKGRFEGSEAEPREGLRGGHIPGSYNLPFNELLTDEGTLKSGEELRAAFETSGIDIKKPVITSCGSGITACVLAFGLHMIGHRDTAVYDGSWTEWALDENLPVQNGSA